MESLHKLEATMASWFKQAPHLPVGGQKWIAQNAWWIVLIGVALSAFGILAILPLLMGASALVTVFGSVYSGNMVLDLWIGLAFVAGVLVLEGMAVMPLKAQQKKGWDLVFMAVLLSALSAVVSAVLLMSVSKLFGAALSLIVGSYFLFEVRSYFKAASEAHSKPKFVAAKK